MESGLTEVYCMHNDWEHKTDTSLCELQKEHLLQQPVYNSIKALHCTR